MSEAAEHRKRKAWKVCGCNPQSQAEAKRWGMCLDGDCPHIRPISKGRPMSKILSWMDRRSLVANGDLVAIALASFCVGMAVSVLIELSVP